MSLQDEMNKTGTYPGPPRCSCGHSESFHLPNGCVGWRYEEQQTCGCLDFLIYTHPTKVRGISESELLAGEKR
jgi:hypothetical protein